MPGMYAVARIVTAKATGAVVLPRDAVATRDNLRVVYKVEGGRIRHVRIVEGLADGQRVQVKSGLSAGDVVVADARRNLADQTPVRPISR